ncbi:MAG TPA: alpha/beta hydrolase [Dactylosporangium sp.]|nr:alpha/beta hydrolase [Dactylosporangium sp.]
MSRRRTAGATALAVLAALFVGGSAAAEPAPGTYATCPNVALAPRLGYDREPDGAKVALSLDARGKYVPIVMVHGWTSSATHTEDRKGTFDGDINLISTPGQSVDVGRSLIGQLQRLHGTAVYTFDYHPYSARWVDDAHLGPALGDAIDCLYKATGEKVIVVGHSMGGLVARWALTHKGHAGADRAGEVSTVITFGTPETGSVIAELAAAVLDGAAAADPDGVFAVLRMFIAVCGEVTSDRLAPGTLCNAFPPLTTFDSDAVRALRAGSQQLAALAPFPPSVHLVALAGDTHLEATDLLGWFALRPWATKDIKVGDVLVGRSSALSGAAETSDVSCSYQLNATRYGTDHIALWLKLAAPNEVANSILSVGGPCFHTNLMRTIELANRVVGVVNKDLNGRGAAGRNAIAPFVGTWSQHGYTLTIRNDLTGEITGINASDTDPGPGPPDYRGSWKLAFTVRGSGIAGTVVSGHDPNGAGPKPGDAFVLRKNAEPGVIDVDFGNGRVSHYCGPPGTYPWAGLCGA